eukprot:TRINITY_DN33563_c0_g1_i1.p1 TRINITY_DN33563_c0_g1~~TRINITY_DN33563_c0_g1_i1.p1  ORF type:complete len:729 (+),score=120.40 TRINITY_DN33563_c0_g1_i1:55-2187(+)
MSSNSRVSGGGARDTGIGDSFLLPDQRPRDARAADDAAPSSRWQGKLSEEQLRGEVLANDPDWPPGLWLVSYMKMHNKLVHKAAEIQSENAQQREAQHDATGMETPTIAASMKLLRKEVFSLCPLRTLAFGVAVSMVLTSLSFVTPLIQGNLVDATLSAIDQHRGDRGSINIVEVIGPDLTIVALLMFCSYCCEILVGILFAICGHTTVTRLRIKLFRNLVIQEIAFYDAHMSGELSSRLINDSQALASLTQFTTQTLLGAIVKFFGSLFAMYWTHPTLALIATVVTPINTLLVRRTGATVGKYGVVQNHAMAKANAVAIEVLGSIRTVQSNVGEPQEGERFMDRLNYYLRVIKATVYIETVLRLTQYGLSRVRDVVVLGMAMAYIIFGSLTVGQYTAFAQFVALYEDGFRNISDIWINFKQTITSTGKFVQLLLREPEINPWNVGGIKPDTCRGSLILQNVSFHYQSRLDRPVLKSLSIEAVPGTIIALVGESGAGKTTLGRLLLRHYDPTGGSIMLDGHDYRSLNLGWLRSQIGFVEQEPVLFDRPLRDNIAYGSTNGADLDSIRQAAELANAHKFICDLTSSGNWEDGYGVHPGERAARISGGQKQRVAIARAVIRNPKVLLLDEATSALDSENEHIVQKALDDLMQGKTTFVIAHRLSTVVRATKILVLDKGQVAEAGTHDELTALGGRYASFMKHQTVDVKPLLD